MKNGFKVYKNSIDLPKLQEAIFTHETIDISRLNANMSNLDIFGFLTKKVATENMRQLFSLFIKINRIKMKN